LGKLKTIGSKVHKAFNIQQGRQKMSEMNNNTETKKEMLRELLMKLHEAAEPSEELKEECKKLLLDLTPWELSHIEKTLISEGMPKEAMLKLCDLHVLLQKETQGEEKITVLPGHPLNILMEEHKSLLQFADELKGKAKEIKSADDFDSIENEMKKLQDIEYHFKESEKHYLREENVLFPYLEKHGITQPPKVMWAEHDEIREKKKKFYQLLETHKNTQFQEFTERLEQIAVDIANKLSNHFYKENNILFPAALNVISEEEWGEIIKQFDEIGYCSFTPEAAKAMPKKEEKPVGEKAAFAGELISFETGSFSIEELETLLNNLPVDITFVDKDDKVRYFSQSKDRIFVRTKAIIGRTVQQCHPEKSVHMVEQILNDFKQGKMDVAEFWLTLNERLIYIRYFPLRNEKGEYLGCLEVTQDITDIKKIEGEKRLL